MDVIAKLLKDAREDMDLSQMDVMKKTGISNKSLSRYENGMTEPDIQTLSVLCSLYGLSLDSALGLRTKDVKRDAISSEERKLLRELREMSDELRSMFYRQAEILSTLENKKQE